MGGHRRPPACKNAVAIQMSGIRKKEISIQYDEEGACLFPRRVEKYARMFVIIHVHCVDNTIVCARNRLNNFNFFFFR